MTSMKKPLFSTLSVTAHVVGICVLSTLASGQMRSVRAAKKVKDVKPVHPRESLQAGDEGAVLVELNITDSGAVEEARILWSGCKRLEKAMLTAVRQWRYEQVRVDGEPVAFKVLTDVSLRLPTAFKSRAGRPGACVWKEAPKPTM